jgi:predicted Zn-ribbon and HTH transcriptional regulator
LSQVVGRPEREVAEHLAHLERSLRHSDEELLVEPAQCLSCGFVFEERRRKSKPGSCPGCRNPRITRPLFSIAVRGR